MNSVIKNYIYLVFIYVVLSVEKSLTSLIDESELENLRESMKHHLDSNKIVKKVPHDCNDRPHIEIDLVFKEDNANGSTYYAVYANKKYYVRIDGITRDHLPIVSRSTQPNQVDTRFLRKMTGKNPINEYKFVGPLYLYKLPNEKGKYSLIGFNNVWLGCPQPMCISPGFDGMLSSGAMPFGEPYGFHSHLHDSIIIIFRGNYFWHFDIGKDRPPMHPPLVDNAIRIEDRWIDRRVDNYRYNFKTKQYERGYLNDSMVVPTYMDAIVPGTNRYNSCLYFFKNDEFVCYEWFSLLSTPQKIANEWKSSNSEWKLAKIDTAFHLKSLIYFITDEKLWCFSSDRMSCHSYPKNLKDLHKDFPTGITSAFVLEDNIYIIKGLLYYKIPVKAFPMKIKDEDLVGKYLFQDLLGCDESLYNAWGFQSYENFIEKIAKRMQTGLSLSTQQQKGSNLNSTFLIIIIIALALSLIIFISIWLLRPIWITKVIQILKMPFRN